MWTPGDILAAPIPAEIDEKKFQLTDDGDVILTEPDNIQFKHKPLDILSERVVALPPEEDMELVRIKNLILKASNSAKNGKKIKQDKKIASIETSKEKARD